MEAGKKRKLTLIKVRGKGPRKTGFRRHKPNTALLKRPESERRKGRTLVEQLPTEILQRILVLSRELNFPRASLDIGARLSHRSFLAELVVKAFVPTWDEWFGCLKRNVASYNGWLEDKDRFAGDSAFQSAVVAAEWFTVDVLHHAMNVWMRQDRQPRFYEHSLNEQLASNLGQSKEHDMDGEQHCKDAKECFDWEFNWFLEAPAVPRPDIQRLEAHPAIRIPDRLLSGPWTKANSRLLFWLSMNNARVKDDQGWELIKPGIDALLDLKSDEADLVVHCFITMGAFKNWPAAIEPLDVKHFRGNHSRTLLQPDNRVGGRRILRKLCEEFKHNFDNSWLGQWAGCNACTYSRVTPYLDLSPPPAALPLLLPNGQSTT